jgi:drug/metabolite transporter (DMT)-like permease
MVGSAAFFAGMGAAVKTASRELPNTSVVFFRNALGLVALVPWLVRLGRRGLVTHTLPEHLIRGAAGLASMYCFFYSVAHLPLAEAMLLNYSLPLFMPLVEGLWLGESTPRQVWWAIAIGFGGLLLILRPGSGVFNPVALVGVASAFLSAVAQVGVRRLTQTEPAARIVFYFAAFATLLSAVPLVRVWRTPSPQLWGTLLLMGMLATGGQLLLTRAYAHAPAAQVGPFIYTSVVFAGLLDAWLWKLWPDHLFLAGAAVVCLAGILALRRDTLAVTPPPEAGGRR